MVRILSVMFFLLLILNVPTAHGQDYLIEITGFGGYTFSDGIDIDDTYLDTDFTVTSLTPTSGATYGFQFDVTVMEHYAVGFLFSQQDSKLEGNIRGVGKTEFTDMAVRNYQAIFTYNVFEDDVMVRPMFFLGLGATQYSPDDVEGRSISSTTKFAFSLGGGVKIFPSNHIGFRFTGRWTPTYINTTDGGYWCGWYYPWGYTCWNVGNANYSHALELAGGLILRF